jgi:ABC-2 type transport system ATP-binding protein
MRSKLGLVPQELALYPTLTAFDNLVFFGRIYGLKGKQLKIRVAAVLEMVGLTDRAKDTIETFSGGMKRRINIAAGLVHEPDILFLDEPTVGVDPHSRNAIFESIETLNQAGLSILYTTHYMEEAERLCDRIAIVDHGRIIAMDSPKEMIRSLGGGIIRMGLQSHFEAVLQRGGEHPAVKAISPADNDPGDNELIIESHHTQDALMALLEITNQLDTRVTSLEVLEPNLETVFLRLTGKSLRD